MQERRAGIIVCRKREMTDENGKNSSRESPPWSISLSFCLSLSLEAYIQRIGRIVLLSLKAYIQRIGRILLLSLSLGLYPMYRSNRIISLSLYLSTYIQCIGLIVLAWSQQDVLAVGVESQIPQADGGHELLGGIELAIASEDGVDELGTGVLAELRRVLALLLAGLEHGGLAGLQELLQLVGEALPGLDEVLDHVPGLLLADAGHALLGALDLAGELDQQEPELAGHVRDGGRGPVVVDGPVVDPLAQAVGVEDAAQEHDGLLGGVPVLERVARGDAVAAGVGLGGLGGRRRLLGRGGRAGGVRSLGRRGRLSTAARGGGGFVARRVT